MTVRSSHSQWGLRSASDVCLFTAQLTEGLAACGRPVVVTAGTGAAGDVLIFLRAVPGRRRPEAPGPGRAEAGRAEAQGWPEAPGGERDHHDRREREAGCALTAYDDAPHRFFALAERR